MSIPSPLGAKLLKSLNLKHKSIFLFLVTLLSFGIVSILLQTHIYAGDLSLQNTDSLYKYGYNIDNSSLLLSTNLNSNLFRPNYLHIYGEDFDYAFFSHATTVDEALTEISITFDDDDIFLPARTDKIVGDMWIKYTKVDNEFEEVKINLPFKTTYTTDNNLPIGQKNIIINGQVGEQIDTYKIVYQNGIQTDKIKISSTISKNPVDEVIAQGAKLVSTKSCLEWDSVIDSYTTNETERFWLKSVMRCESGCNENNVSSSGVYKGLFQYNESTFNSGGGGNIFDGAQQIEQTLRRYRAGQLTKWPVCNKKAQAIMTVFTN